MDRVPESRGVEWHQVDTRDFDGNDLESAHDELERDLRRCMLESVHEDSLTLGEVGSYQPAAS
jgi:hypothetical protein